MSGVSNSRTQIVVVERRWGGMDTHSCDDRLGLAKLGMNLASCDIVMDEKAREEIFRKMREHLNELYQAFKEET